MNPIHLCNQNISPETIFRTETKSHNSDNNWWILSVFELELYFIVIQINPIHQWIQKISHRNIFKYMTYAHTGKGGAISPTPFKWLGHNELHCNLRPVKFRCMQQSKAQTNKLNHRTWLESRNTFYVLQMKDILPQPNIPSGSLCSKRAKVVKWVRMRILPLQSI